MHLVGALVVELYRVELVGIEAEQLLDALPEGGQIPLVRIDIPPAVGLDGLVDRALAQGQDVLVGIDLLVLLDDDRAFEQLPAQRVDVLALLVHHVVVLEQVLADGEVLRLHLLLRAFDGLGYHAVLDRHALFHPETVHQPLNAIRPEDPHQVVLQRQVEARRPGVSLPSGAPAELVVDASRLVPLGADDVQPARLDDGLVIGLGLRHVPGLEAIPVRARHPMEAVVREIDELLVVDELLLALRQPLGRLVGQRLPARHVVGIAAEQDVGAASCHVGGDGHRARAARLGHDFGFLVVVLRVEDHVLDAAALEQARQPLGLLDRDRADQHRPSSLLLLDDVVDDGDVLLPLGAVDEVGLLDADQLAVGRHREDVELVDLGELGGFGLGRPGHAGQLLVLAEVVLEGDRGQGLVLALDLDLFLGLHRLVQPVAPAPAGHEAPGELVDDHHLAVLDHVVDVALEEAVGAQRLVDVVQERHVGRVVQSAGLQAMLEQLLADRHAAFGQRDGLVLLVLEEIAGVLELLPTFRRYVALGDGARLQARDDPVHLVVQLRRLLGGPRDDERGPGLVDQDAVNLVHDREVMAALHELRHIELHVVAEVVEAELVVRAVGDVATVCRVALRVAQIMLNHADRHPEEAVDAAHPVGVPASEVVVDGDDVHALAGEGVEVGGKGRDEGLALTGLHLGDLAAVQHDAADELHVEVPHAQHAPSGLAHHCEGVDQQVVERGSLVVLRAQIRRTAAEIAVGERAYFVLTLPDGGDQGLNALEIPLVLGAEDLGQ